MGRSTPLIRRATPADIAAVAELVMLHTGVPRTNWEARLREDLIEPDRALLVAEADTIVGYGRVHRFRAPRDAPENVAPDGYYLVGLIVNPASRGQGIGAALTQARLSWIGDRATEASYFTNAHNQRSLRLHQRLGFQEITRDFVFPGVSFDGGVGVLSCAKARAITRKLSAMAWFREGFVHPDRVDLPTGHHLRPIREADVDIDYPAVMGSRTRLWAKYGDAWGWPAPTMSYQADKADLARHEAEIASHETFNYAILNEQETALLGCVYIDPPDTASPPGTDAVVSWWVVDDQADTELERALDEFVPGWLDETWRFEAVHYFP